jgi:hypothetical protein
MQVGCGVYVHEVRSRPYLYFWHYETRSGSRVQLTRYVGPAGSSRARSAAAELCQAYYARAADDLERMRDAALASVRTISGRPEALP